MNVNRRTFLFSVAICATIFMLQSHHLRKEASIVKQEEIYTYFMDKFIDEFAEIIEKIEKETIPFLKNQERLNSSEETEKWAKLIEGRNLLYNLTQIFGQ